MLLLDRFITFIADKGINGVGRTEKTRVRKPELIPGSGRSMQSYILTNPKLKTVTLYNGSGFPLGLRQETKMFAATAHRRWWEEKFLQTAVITNGLSQIVMSTTNLCEHYTASWRSMTAIMKSRATRA